MSFITGVGLTAYGRHEGSSGLDLMSKAAQLAITDAALDEEGAARLSVGKKRHARIKAV